MGKDTALGFRDLPLQMGYAFFGLAGRTSALANRKPGRFEGLHGITVLFELNPMPSDIAIAVSRHVPAAHSGRPPRQSFRMINYRRILVNDRLMAPVFH
jgi:hypothetical protein